MSETQLLLTLSPAINWSDDDAEAMEQAEAYLLQYEWGGDHLVFRSFEFADDQKMLEAVRQLPGIGRWRRIEEQLLARWLEQRLMHFAKGAYERGGIELELDKSTVQYNQAVQQAAGPITEADVDGLDCKFDCAGCGRKEVSKRSKDGHQRPPLPRPPPPPPRRHSPGGRRRSLTRQRTALPWLERAWGGRRQPSSPKRAAGLECCVNSAWR